MAKRIMLIDAAHPEETRVVVTSGTRLEEFDFESSTKRQVKGNIYLAKVTRVEPSLQATFVDYGGNRHGFLAFSEIHPDYYRIPVSDRPREAFEPASEEIDDEPEPAESIPLAEALPEPVPVPPAPLTEDETTEDAPPHELEPAVEDVVPREPVTEPHAAPAEAEPEEREWTGWSAPAAVWEEPSREPETIALRAAEDSMLAIDAVGVAEVEPAAGAEIVETLGGDEVDEVEEADAERRRTLPVRHYKIQEVVKRRQIMLVQVAKEERGNKGAALTTYLSLAGRYCVLMPNTNRGGGVSRKITSLADRRRLKEILEDLDIPEGMGVIVRTAGAERSKAEIRRDYEYLLRLWNEIRELTLQSTAPALIYEEGNLIKRSIRDLYTRDIDEVLVEGEDGYKTAKAFMRTLMPSHAKRVQPYRDPQIGLYHRFQIESQIDAIHSPVAQLRSGGYLVINQTEALVAIDVNSGRATRERNIEETALRTNLEAAEEISRQLRLRDLAGLIVIDFIDMEEHRNQIAVERRLKEALKNDRARIQVGRISPFGLLEMSRQRLRPSLAEASTEPCPHCGGTGHIRSVESTALYVLRSIEEEGIRRRSAEVCVYVPTNVALYVLNQKRQSLAQIEARYGVRVTLAQDDSLIPPNFRLERLRAFGVGETPPLRPVQAPTLVEEDEDEDEDEDTDEAAEAAIGTDAAMPADTEGEEERGRRRRRRRRRRPEEPRQGRVAARRTAAKPKEAVGAVEEAKPREEHDGEREAEAERRRRRRGRRGGRARTRREAGLGAEGEQLVAAEAIEIVVEDANEGVTAESGMMPAPEPWPGDAGIETASLAPLAGESDTPAAVHERNHEPAAAAAPVPSAETEEGVPFTSPAERVLEEAVVAATQAVPSGNGEPAPREPAAAEDVLEVTEKPANPRRGWWQRLIQP